MQNTARNNCRGIAVLNHKGGTGKTTTAVNLAAGLAEAGHRVLLIDADPQGAVGTSLGIQGEYGTHHLLAAQAAVADCAVPIRDNLDIVTTDHRLATLEARLAMNPEERMILRRALERTPEYAFVVVDCPPAISPLVDAVLLATGEIVVPVSCDYLSMVTVKQIFATVERMSRTVTQAGHAPRVIEVTGVLPTFYDVRNRISHDVLTTLESYFPQKVLPPVRVNTKLREAPSWRKTIFEYAPTSHGAEDYRVVVEHVLSRRPQVGAPQKAS